MLQHWSLKFGMDALKLGGCHFQSELDMWTWRLLFWKVNLVDYRSSWSLAWGICSFKMYVGCGFWFEGVEIQDHQIRHWGVELCPKMVSNIQHISRMWSALRGPPAHKDEVILMEFAAECAKDHVWGLLGPRTTISQRSQPGLVVTRQYDDWWLLIEIYLSEMLPAIHR